MKKIVLMLCLSISLFAYSDNDMDGVDNEFDLCPNTPFSELIDVNGCSIKSLVSPHHFDIIYGVSLSEMDSDKTFSQSFQFDYYYKNFSVSASTSAYESDIDSGEGDSFLGMNYKIKFDKLDVRFGVGMIFPTYEEELSDNKTDYTTSISLSYQLKSINIYSGYGFTKINDESSEFTYQDTNSYNIGAGFYPLSSLYLSLSYRDSESVYVGTDSAQTFSVYSSYSINKNWFSSFSYSLGLSESANDNYTSLRLGYYF